MQTAVSASDQIFGLEGGTGIPDLASSSTSDLVPEEERPEESGPGRLKAVVAPGRWPPCRGLWTPCRPRWSSEMQSGLER